MRRCILYLGQTPNFSLVVFCGNNSLQRVFCSLAFGGLTFSGICKCERVVGYLNYFYPAIVTIALWQGS